MMTEYDCIWCGGPTVRRRGWVFEHEVRCPRCKRSFDPKNPPPKPKETIMSIRYMYAIMGHSDTTEGRGPMRLDALAPTKQQAIDIILKSERASGLFVMGYRNSTLSEIEEFLHLQVVPVFETPEEYDAYDKTKRRQEALNKLTLEERRLLGLE